jgi:hypothetical protein
MTFREFLAPLSGLAMATIGLLPGISAPGRADVILHAFDWPYAEVARRLLRIDLRPASPQTPINLPRSQ